MLSLALTVLSLTVLSVQAMWGGGSPSYPGFPAPYPPQGPNLYALLEEKNARAGVLSGSDDLLNAGISDAGYKVNLAAQFRQRFEQDVLPGIQQGVSDRTRSIQELRAQLLALASLFDDVRALASDTDNLLDQLRQVRASRVKDVEEPLSTLANADIDQNADIARPATQVGVTESGVTTATGRVEANEQQAGILYDSLIDVVNTVNKEIYETFTVELTAAAPNATIAYSTPFPAGPHVVYGIISFKATRNDQPAPSYGGYGPQPNNGPHAQGSGYGGYAPPPPSYSAPHPSPVAEILATNIRVNGDANGFTIYLIDDSSLWQVDSVRLRISAGYVGEDILQFRGH